MIQIAESIFLSVSRKKKHKRFFFAIWSPTICRTVSRLPVDRSLCTQTASLLCSEMPVRSARMRKPTVTHLRLICAYPHKLVFAACTPPLRLDLSRACSQIELR